MNEQPKVKASELRIGNIIAFRGFECPLTASDILAINKEEKSKRCLPTFAKPIPLTEERLLKSNLERIGNVAKTARIKWYRVAKGLYLKVEEGIILLCVETFSGIDIDALELLYVHQLQNLYFSLTGNELTI